MEQIINSNAPSFLSYSVTEMVVNIGTSIVIGFWLALLYQKTHKGLSYSQSFTQTIILVTVIVAIVTMVIGGSLARAFALVGAMSIIRFRTVLKDTKDLSFIFGALALGMAAGTSNYVLAGLGVVVMSVIIFTLDLTNFGSVYKSEFILRFRFDRDGDSAGLLVNIKELCKRANLLHVEPSGDGSSLLQTYDVALRDDVSHSLLVESLNTNSEVSEVVLIASKSDVNY